MNAEDGSIVWQKSLRCGPDNGCVEITKLPSRQIGVRDSKIAATSPILSFTASEWKTLLDDIKDGKLDLA